MGKVYKRNCNQFLWKYDNIAIVQLYYHISMIFLTPDLDSVAGLGYASKKAAMAICTQL